MKTDAQKRAFQRLASSAKTDSSRLHIIARKGEWVLRKKGNPKALSIFKTKIEAIKDAKNHLESGQTDKVVIHKKDGTIAKVI